MGCGLQGHKELDMTEVNQHTCISTFMLLYFPVGEPNQKREKLWYNGLTILYPADDLFSETPY